MSTTDGLSVFTVMLAHCLALQVVKDVTGAAPRSVAGTCATGALAVTIVSAHARPGSDGALVALAVAGMFALGVNGSQSNHVLLELAIAGAVLVSAPWGALMNDLLGGRGKGGEGGGVDRGRNGKRRRDAFSRRVTRAMRAALAVLYAMTGFAKLNDAWHDPSTSCCVQMYVGALTAWGVPATHATLFHPAALRAMPYAATAFELGFPVALLASTPGSLGARGLAMAGGLFHVFIALPPPPMSVYPFSMIMAPMYVAALVPAEAGAAARGLAASPLRVRAGIGAVLATLTAHAWQLNRASSYFEYPPYFAWEVGVLWVALAFGFVAAVAVLGVTSEGTSSSASSESTTEPGKKARGGAARDDAKPGGEWSEAVRSSYAPLLPALFVFLVSASTYFGVRTYPSFAMFSNLLLEGGASNHWVVRSPLSLVAAHAVDTPAAASATADRARHYGPDVAIEVLDTDLPALRHLQVNLAPLLPPRVLGALDATNVTAEFHITPPAWPYPPTETTFRPFSAPLTEIRRRVSTAEQGDFFVAYRWVLRGEREERVREYRRVGGTTVAGAEEVLGAPLPRARAVLHRFRTFDLDRSPCRH